MNSMKVWVGEAKWAFKTMLQSNEWKEERKKVLPVS